MIPLRHRTLDNGLHVVVQADPWLPLVAVHVRYHVGRIHDPVGRGGLAHLVEHLAFRSLAHMDDGDLKSHLHRIAATGINGTTSAFSTDYYETVPAGDLETALWLESERMGFFGRPPARLLASEIEVVLAEDVFRHSGARAGWWEALAQALFPSPHPRGRTSFDEIGDVKPGEVAEFVRTWMGPGNATLVLVGDVPPDVDRLVDRYFGDLQGGERPPEPSGLETPLVGDVRLVHNEPLPSLTFYWRLPEPSDEADDAMAAVLSWAFDHQAPGGDLPGVASIFGGTEQGPRGAFALWVGASVEHADPLSVLPVVDQALEKVRQHGVSPTRLTRTQRRLTTRYARKLEPYADRARVIAERIDRDPLADLDAWPRAIEAVRGEQIQALASQLGPDRVVVVTKPEGEND